jgi:hypothetical protein
MKELFGGSESTSKPVDATPDDVAKLRQNAADAFTSFFKNKGGPQYTGPLVAQLGGNEQQLLDMLMQDAGGSSGRQGLLASTIAGDFLSNGNPFLQQAIQSAQRPTADALSEVLSRQLPSQFTQAGQMVSSGSFADRLVGGNAAPGGSSAFDRASALAFGKGSQALSDIATNMSFGAYEAERGRQQQAIQLSQQEVETTMANLQAQALPRLIEDLGIERGIELFKQRSQELLAAFGSLGQIGALTNIGQQQKSESFGGIIPALFPKGMGGGSAPTGA